MDEQNRVQTAAGLSMVARSGVSAPSWAMAHRNARRSRAMAPTTWWAFFPLALRCLERLHSRIWAFHLLAWSGLAPCSRRRCSCRRTCAGEREAQAPATSTRRAWLWPVFVMPPGRRRAPVAYAAGVKPRECMSCLGVANRVRSPRAAPVVTATVHGTPRRAWSAATTGASRQVCTWSSVLVPDVPDVPCVREPLGGILGKRSAAPLWDRRPH